MLVKKPFDVVRNYHKTSASIWIGREDIKNYTIIKSNDSIILKRTRIRKRIRVPETRLIFCRVSPCCSLSREVYCAPWYCTVILSTILSFLLSPLSPSLFLRLLISFHFSSCLVSAALASRKYIMSARLQTSGTRHVQWLMYPLAFWSRRWWQMLGETAWP